MVAGTVTLSTRSPSTSSPFAAGERSTTLVTQKKHAGRARRNRFKVKNDQEDLDRPGPVAPEGIENPCRGLFEDLRALGGIDVLDDKGVAFQFVELVHRDHFQV